MGCSSCSSMCLAWIGVASLACRPGAFRCHTSPWVGGLECTRTQTSRLAPCRPALVVPRARQVGRRVQRVLGFTCKYTGPSVARTTPTSRNQSGWARRRLACLRVSAWKRRRGRGVATSVSSRCVVVTGETPKQSVKRDMILLRPSAQRRGILGLCFL